MFGCLSIVNWHYKIFKINTLLEIFPILEKSSLHRGLQAAIKSGMSSVISNTLNRKPLPLYSASGQQIHQNIIVKPIKWANSAAAFIQISDVSPAVNRERQIQLQARKTEALAEKLAQQKERAQVTLESIADAVITTDKDGLILSLNPVAEILINVAEDIALGQHVSNFYSLLREDDNQPIPCTVTECLRLQDVVSNQSDHVLVCATGMKYAVTDSVAPIMDADNRLLGAVLVFRDVSESRALSAELNWQAEHDPLTGLANRRAFEKRMKQLLESAKHENTVHHLLYLDLDQFKVVNDSCGHDSGDQLLKQISVILQEQLRKSDLLARLGGDEFGVLLGNCDEEPTCRIANNLRIAIQDFRFGWQTKSFKIGVSIGIARISNTEKKASKILSDADAACYIAKQQGRNRLHFHQHENSESSSHQKEMQWISRIQSALDEDRFVLFAQRIQDTLQLDQPSNHFEILLRMVDTDGTLIPPGAFLPAAERFNLMASIDRWVFDQIFTYMDRIASLKAYTFSLNISGMSFMDEALLAHILIQLDKMPWAAKKLCVEVTETAAIANLSKATHFLSKLREKGCRIALDDFGSGLSSFAYLKTLPIDFLKIDGHFVKDIADDPIDRAFVESINQIGQVMGLATIAEFVENDAILQVLVDIGVNYAQGYGIHKPARIEELF